MYLLNLDTFHFPVEYDFVCVSFNCTYRFVITFKMQDWKLKHEKYHTHWNK